MALIMNFQNLQQEDAMSLMIKIKQNMEKEMKMIQALNLKQKLSNQVFGTIQIRCIILVTGDIIVTDGDENANVAFKNYAPFTTHITHINDENIDTAENLDIMMPMYNLIVYSDNYSATSGKLWHFKRDESGIYDAINLGRNSSSF